MAKCNLTNLCGIGVGTTLKTVRNSPVMAPFVMVTISSTQDPIIALALSIAGGNNALSLGSAFIDRTVGVSVGNKSNPAVVKSIQIGSSNGTGCDIEIVDQQTGDFAQIFQKISRGGRSADFRVKVRWGWIDTNCDGAIPQFQDIGKGDPTSNDDASSAENNFLLLNMAVNYTMGGTVKYTINCTDWVQSLYDSNSKFVFEKVTLKSAINQLLSQKNLKIKFAKFDDAKTEGEFRFEQKGDGSIDPKEGPIGTWSGNSRNLLAIIQEWLRPYVAGVGKDGKGLRLFYEPTRNPPELIAMVYTNPTCEPTIFEKFNVATYIVNGANCSPVLNFQTSIKYNGGPIFQGSGVAPGNLPGAMPMKGPSPCLANSTSLPNIYSTNGIINIGQSIAVSFTRQEILTRLKEAMNLGLKGTMLNLAANYYTAPIQTDLRVIGDPTFSRPFLFVGRFVTLIVVNPYQISSGCLWTNQAASSTSICDQVLTQTQWMIEGVFHDIKNGSYTTTLKLKLAAPGQDVALTRPPGG